MYLIDSHDAILHVEIQSFLFLPKYQALTVAMVHIGCLNFAPERNIRVPQQLQKNKDGPMKDFSNASFAPETLDIMKKAMDAAVASLPDPVSSAHVQSLAETILRTAKEGERDPSTLQRMALLELQIAPRN